MKLYVANTTKQNHAIPFRVPENDKLITKTCVAGGQIVLWEGSTAEIEAIISQISIYNWVDHKSLDRNKEFVGAVFSIDKPITAAHIAAGIDRNDDVLTSRAHEDRKNIAVAADTNLRQIARDGGPNGPDIGSVRMELEEEGKIDREPTMPAEEIEVAGPGDKPSPRRGRRARR